MELSVYYSSSSYTPSFLDTKFSFLSSPYNIPKKKKRNRISATHINDGTRAMAVTSSSSSVWNGQTRSGSFGATANNKQKLYTPMESCLVIPPPNGKKPRAILKFLGGAFIGAVPELTYSYLIELLAKDGFLIISVPYNVTFDHAHATKQVYDSNGALLQVLTGSYFCDQIPKANAIISYNNRPATEAVPYFEQLGPLVSQMVPLLESSPAFSMARSASGDAWKLLVETAGTMVPNNEQDTLVSLTKFVDQLPSVFNEVTQGISEFKPTPSENCDCFRNSYNVKHTLLVKFNSDTIDETDLLEETLKFRVESIDGTLEKVNLSGNHITPCIQEPKWQVGYVYTPVDAVAQVLKNLSLNDTRVLSRTISDWFRRFEDQNAKS